MASIKVRATRNCEHHVYSRCRVGETAVYDVVIRTPLEVFSAA